MKRWQKTVAALAGFGIPMALQFTLSGCSVDTQVGNSVVSNGSSANSTPKKIVPAAGLITVGQSIAVQSLQHDDANYYEMEIDAKDGTIRWYATSSALAAEGLSLAPSNSWTGTFPFYVTVKREHVSQMTLTRLPDTPDRTDGTSNPVQENYILTIPENQLLIPGTYQEKNGKTHYTVHTSMVH